MPTPSFKRSRWAGGAMGIPHPWAAGCHWRFALRPSRAAACRSSARRRACSFRSPTWIASFVPQRTKLRLLFGLTAAEARLADAIFDGLSLPEAADRFGLSLHKVRFQIARVFEKSGVARQTDLVKLMMRLAG